MFKKLLYSLILFLVLKSVYSQNVQVKNMPNYDRQWWHPGFTLGFNTSDFVVKLGGDLNQADSLYQVTSQSSSGLNLGIVLNLKLHDNFDLRFIPTLTFSARELDYTFAKNGVVDHIVSKNVQSTFADFPLDIKFKSVRINNYRIYVLGGAKYAIDFVSQSKVKDLNKQIVKLQQNDFGWELGVGIDIYFEYFKFSPELKVFHGMRNLLVKENTAYSNYLDGLFSKIFYISFCFE